MPPNSPQIPAREQDIIRRWIEGGLVNALDQKRKAKQVMAPASPIVDGAKEVTNEAAEGLVAIRAFASSGCDYSA